MKSEEYKQHIIEEYERLMVEERQNDSLPYIHLIMYGNEGLEGYLVTKDVDKLSVIHRMELRARFNTHRNIGVYGFLSNFIVKQDDINEELLELDKVVRLY
jgi:hypothetical protein